MSYTNTKATLERSKRDRSGFNGGFSEGVHLQMQAVRSQECIDRGLVLTMFGDRESAMRFYRKALLLDTESSLAHYMLGVALMNSGEVEEALKEWRLTTETTRKGSQADWARGHAKKLLRTYNGE